MDLDEDWNMENIGNEFNQNNDLILENQNSANNKEKEFEARNQKSNSRNVVHTNNVNKSITSDVNINTNFRSIKKN